MTQKQSISVKIESDGGGGEGYPQIFRQRVKVDFYFWPLDLELIVWSSHREQLKSEIW